MTTEERYNMIYGNNAMSLNAEPKEVERRVKKEKKEKKEKVAIPAVNLFELEWRNKSLYLAILLIICMSLSYVNFMQHNRQLQKKVAAATIELDEIKKKNSDLEAEIASKSDLDDIKRIAIVKYGMVKPREDHIIKYSIPSSDYVRQFGSIPE